MIHINRHPSGRFASACFGLACLADGLVRTLSLGFLHTSLPLRTSRWQARRYFERSE
jgi:hypothetical protein